MEKLLNLKDWLTISETAHHLSKLLEDEITEADVLRLGLDTKLTLSVYFPNMTFGRMGKFIDNESYRGEDLPHDHADYGFPISVSLDFESNKIVTLSKVYDLLMTDSVKLFIEQKYQELSGGPDITTFPMTPFYISYDDHIFEILKSEQNVKKKPNSRPFDHYSSEYSLPSDAVLVVKTLEIKKLEVMPSNESALIKPNDLSPE